MNILLKFFIGVQIINISFANTTKIVHIHCAITKYMYVMGEKTLWDKFLLAKAIGKYGGKIYSGKKYLLYYIMLRDRNTRTIATHMDIIRNTWACTVAGGVGI